MRRRTAGVVSADQAISKLVLRVDREDPERVIALLEPLVTDARRERLTRIKKIRSERDMLLIPAEACQISCPCPDCASATRMDHGWPVRLGSKTISACEFGMRRKAIDWPSGAQTGSES